MTEPTYFDQLASALREVHRPAWWHPIRRRSYDRRVTDAHVGAMLKASLRGEFDPIQSMGISISAKDLAPIDWGEGYTAPGVFVPLCRLCGCAVSPDLKDRHEQWHRGIPPGLGDEPVGV